MEWLRQLRKKKGLQQKQIARMVGIGQSGYSMIENKERIPSVPTAKKIAAVLGFNWTRFYEDEVTL